MDRFSCAGVCNNDNLKMLNFDVGLNFLGDNKKSPSGLSTFFAVLCYNKTFHFPPVLRASAVQIPQSADLFYSFPYW